MHMGPVIALYAVGLAIIAILTKIIGCGLGAKRADTRITSV